MLQPKKSIKHSKAQAKIPQGENTKVHDTPDTPPQFYTHEKQVSDMAQCASTIKKRNLTKKPEKTRKNQKNILYIV